MFAGNPIQNNLLSQSALLTTFCIESPVRVCFDKLSRAKHQHISLEDIAWLQAINEMNFMSFCEIEKENQTLLKRIDKLKEYLFHISHKNNMSISPKYDGDSGKEIDYFKKIINRHFVSARRAIEYFTAIRAMNRFETHKEEAAEIERARRRLFQYQLAEMDLTTELVRTIRDCCKNKPVTLVLSQLPSAIWLKILAHYLAISSKNYESYGDIEYDDQKLLNDAISIHKFLYEKLSEILNIKLNELSLMTPSHREIANKEGILNIAVVAINPSHKIPDHWSVEVTKELAL